MIANPVLDTSTYRDQLSRLEPLVEILKNTISVLENRVSTYREQGFSDQTPASDLEKYRRHLEKVEKLIEDIKQKIGSTQ